MSIRTVYVVTFTDKPVTARVLVVSAHVSTLPSLSLDEHVLDAPRHQPADHDVVVVCASDEVDIPNVCAARGVDQLFNAEHREQRCLVEFNRSHDTIDINKAQNRSNRAKLITGNEFCAGYVVIDLTGR